MAYVVKDSSNGTDQLGPILRIILEDLKSQVQRVPLVMLVKVLNPILYPCGRWEEFPPDSEKTRNESEIYVLGGIITLITEVLLRARFGSPYGEVCNALDPYTGQSIERLYQELQRTYVFTSGKTDLLGRVIQSLLVSVTRKSLAAFYSKPIVAKFVSHLLIKGRTGLFFDPACGTGAMLTAAFQRFQELDDETTPLACLAKLAGNEVSAIARLCTETNLKLIAAVPPETQITIWQRDAFHMEIPPSLKVDFLGTNPPFTRGERLSLPYKSFLREFFAEKISPTGEAKSIFCATNMPLHGYFLLDMDRFLRPGGRFGVVLPASTLHLAGLKGIRKYLLTNYKLEYIFTSDVESFSEDSDLKEIIIVGRLWEHYNAQKPLVEEKVTFVTTFMPLCNQNYAEISNAIEYSKENKQAGNAIRIHRVSQKEMGEGLADWSVFFPLESNVEFNEKIWSTGKIGLVRDLERDSIEAFRGFRQDFAKYWAVPNRSWKLIESQPAYIKIQNVEDPKANIVLRSNSWYQGLSRPEFYPRPLIQSGYSYILKETPSDMREDGMDQYLAWIERQFRSDVSKHGKFIRQLHQIGTRFNFAGRIAFCHRIDVTTSKVVCYWTQDPLQLNQNWFSIRGLDPITEKFLVAWFNSTCFIASYMLRRRTQRGPYGQTAVREFKEYPIPLRDKLDPVQIQRVIDQFHVFNQSAELDFPICRQFSRCLSQETARTEFDIVVLDTIQVFPSDRQKQRQFLDQIYHVLVAKIDKIRLQAKHSTL